MQSCTDSPILNQLPLMGQAHILLQTCHKALCNHMEASATAREVALEQPPPTAVSPVPDNRETGEGDQGQGSVLQDRRRAGRRAVQD